MHAKNVPIYYFNELSMFLKFFKFNSSESLKLLIRAMKIKVDGNVFSNMLINRLLLDKNNAGKYAIVIDMKMIKIFLLYGISPNFALITNTFKVLAMDLDANEPIAAPTMPNNFIKTMFVIITSMPCRIIM